VRSAIVEGESGAGDEVAHRLGHKDLAGLCPGSHARANRNGDAGDLAVEELTFAGMDAARISRPSSCMSSPIANAQRMARAGPSKLAKNPSPAVSSSRPRKRTSRARIRR
jgi:hypothetical protein